MDASNVVERPVAKTGPRGEQSSPSPDEKPQQEVWPLGEGWEDMELVEATESKSWNRLADVLAAVAIKEVVSKPVAKFFL